MEAVIGHSKEFSNEFTVSDLPEPWLSKRAIADYLSCSTRKIERLMSRGMPHARLGAQARFRCSAVDKWLESGEAQA